jgi:hypothetical protein
LRSSLTATKTDLLGEDQQKQALLDDLERKNELMQWMCEQLQGLEQQIEDRDKQQERRELEYLEMQRRYEEVAAADASRPLQPQEHFENDDQEGLENDHVELQQKCEDTISTRVALGDLSNRSTAHLSRDLKNSFGDLSKVTAFGLSKDGGDDLTRLSRKASISTGNRQ